MESSWLSILTLWLQSHTMFVMCGSLIILGWQLPTIRYLALIHLSVELLRSYLMGYLTILPADQALHYEYLGRAAVNLIKVLLILMLIGMDIKHLCRTTIYLLSIFFLLGLADIGRYVDRFISGGDPEISNFSTSYAVVVPAFSWMVLVVLVLPIIKELMTKKTSSAQGEEGEPDSYLK